MNKNINKITLPYEDDFLLALRTNNFSLKTVYNYERDLKVFEGFLNDIKISFKNVNKKTILNYKAYLTSLDRLTPKNQLSQKELSSFSINRMLSALRSYLKFLIDMDHSTSIAPDMIKLVKTEKKTPRVSGFDEIIKLIESPTKLEKNEKIAVRNRAILEMFFSTGMRVSELINVKSGDIDKQGRIFVRGKGKKERFVYLTPRAKHYLEIYLKLRGLGNSCFIFVPFRGKNVRKKNNKLSANYLQEKIKNYRELLGINVPVSPHGLRRAFATYLAENGASPAAIQILLGHESLATTTRYVNASTRFAEKIHRRYHPLKDK